MIEYSAQVNAMCPITKGPKHGPAPIPEEGQWVKAYKIEDISGYTHGVGWCAPQQGTCKLSLNIKNGIIEEALVETIGCSGMTHSAAMAGEILPGKTILEALNTDLVCDAINVAMRELFLQIVYGRSQTAFSEDGLPIGAGLDDLGKGLRSMTGTIFSKIINDISNIVQNIVLSLSANMLLYDSLKNSVDNIENKRFKKEYSIFVNNYRMYNFNIVKAVDEFSQKFSFYEFNMFLSLLIQGEKEGNLLELLESFIENLDITYFKYLKYKSTQRLVVIIFTTFISIVNSFLIVLYPIVIQVSQSFTDIFK